MYKKIMVWTVLSMVILLFLNGFSRGGEIKELSPDESKALLNAYYVTGRQYFEDGNFHEARQEFNKVLDIEPGHPGAMEYIELIDHIDAKMEDKNPHLLEEAKDKEKEIVHAKRKSFKEYYEHGLKYYQKAEYGKAIAAFSYALQIKPDDKAVRKYLDKCFSKLDTASKDKPVNVSESTHDDSKKLYTQAKQLVKDNKFKEAVEILTQYIEKHPQDQNARNLLHDTQMKALSLEQKEIEAKDKYQRQSRLLEVEQATIPTVEEKKAMITEGEKLETGVIKIGKEEKEAIKEIEQKTQQLVSLDFKDTDLREVIKYLVELTDVNIVLDEKVFDNSMSGQMRSEADRRGHGPDTEGVDSSGPITPEVTIFVKDIPLIRALDIILRAKGLKYKIEKDFIWVATPANLEREDLEIRIYSLKHLAGGFVNFPAPPFKEGETFTAPKIEGEYKEDKPKPQTIGPPTAPVGQGMDTGIQVGLSAGNIRDILLQVVPQVEGSSIMLYERLGKLIARNTPANLKVLEEVLTALDVSSMQVSLETRIVEVSSFEGLDIGVDWEKIEGIHYDGKIVHDQGQFGLEATPTGGLEIRYATLDTPELDILLRALEKRGDSSVLSAPKLTCLNNQTANIRILKNHHYVSRWELNVIGWGNSNWLQEQWTPFLGQVSEGLILEVIPNVSADKKTIALTVHPSIVELLEMTPIGDKEHPIMLPSTVSRSTDTTVSIKNGKTLVMGGLMRNVDKEDTRKVPVLGSIPLLGKLFQAKTKYQTKSNLLIFITARILNSEGEALY